MLTVVYHAQTKDIKRKETANDSESNIGNEDDDTMDCSEEATDVQSEVGGVSNHLTKSLTLNKVGSSQNSDVMSDSTEQEATPEVIPMPDNYSKTIFDE